MSEYIKVKLPKFSNPFKREKKYRSPYKGSIDWYDVGSKAVVVGTVVAVVLVIVGIVVGIYQEMTEIDAGEIFAKNYHPAYTTQVPITSTYTDANGNVRTITTGYRTVHHPERFEVRYRAYNDEKEKWEVGDDDVPGFVWEKLSIGDMYKKGE